MLNEPFLLLWRTWFHHHWTLSSIHCFTIHMNINTYICKTVLIFSLATEMCKLNIKTVLISNIWGCLKFISLFRIVNYPILKRIPLKMKVRGNSSEISLYRSFYFHLKPWSMERSQFCHRKITSPYLQIHPIANQQPECPELWNQARSRWSDSKTENWQRAYCGQKFIFIIRLISLNDKYSLSKSSL